MSQGTKNRGPCDRFEKSMLFDMLVRFHRMAIDQGHTLATTLAAVQRNLRNSESQFLHLYLFNFNRKCQANLYLCGCHLSAASIAVNHMLKDS